MAQTFRPTQCHTCKLFWEIKQKKKEIGETFRKKLPVDVAVNSVCPDLDNISFDGPLTCKAVCLFLGKLPNQLVKVITRSPSGAAQRM